MNDLISRQAAIDELKYCQTYLFDTRDKDKKVSREDVEYMLEHLPSAQPDEIFFVKTNRFLSPDELKKLKENLKSQSKNIVLLSEDCSLVYPERKKGKWIPHKSVFGGLDEKVYTCSQCGYNIGFHTENFCPNCGADMRQIGGDTDES